MEQTYISTTAPKDQKSHDSSIKPLWHRREENSSKNAFPVAIIIIVHVIVIITFIHFMHNNNLVAFLIRYLAGHDFVWVRGVLPGRSRVCCCAGGGGRGTCRSGTNRRNRFRTPMSLSHSSSSMMLILLSGVVILSRKTNKRRREDINQPHILFLIVIESNQASRSSRLSLSGWGLIEAKLTVDRIMSGAHRSQSAKSLRVHLIIHSIVFGKLFMSCVDQ